MCLCWRAFNWFCNSETSKSIIDSQSLMTASPMPSCSNRNRSFSVDTTTSSVGMKSLLVNTLGYRSLVVSRASIHVHLSSLDAQRKWRVFVPVNMESLRSSDLLARIEETYKATEFQQTLKQRKNSKDRGHMHTLDAYNHAKQRWENTKVDSPRV